jgi:hypothetical protein
MNRRVDIVVLGHVFAPAPLAEVGARARTTIGPNENPAVKKALEKTAKPSPVLNTAPTADKTPAASPPP